MKTPITFLLIIMWAISASAQYDYEPSAEHPFGLPNPEAPREILDFAGLIGECDCKSVSRNPDQSWGDPVDMLWRFKYIMNGKGIQDETLKADGQHSGSIRQFIADSTRWYVHYYSSLFPSTQLPAWEGTKQENGDIILYREQKAPNGMDGFYKIMFTDISNDGFKWLGQWVSPDETITYPTWKIDCTKRKPGNSEEASRQIKNAAEAFSQAYISGDYDALARAFTEDAKIFPNNSDIITGREAIKNRWILPEGQKILSHKITPEEINVLGDYAFDYGYYSGVTQMPDGEKRSWKGKYVVVWKLTKSGWKMYLDIWNRI